MDYGILIEGEALESLDLVPGTRVTVNIEAAAQSENHRESQQRAEKMLSGIQEYWGAGRGQMLQAGYTSVDG